MYLKFCCGIGTAVFFLFFSHSMLIAQKKDITRDTTLANTYFAAGEKCYKETKYDSSIVWYRMAGLLYQTHKVWRRYVECLDLTNVSYRMIAKYDHALLYCDSFARAASAQWGQDDPEVANAYSSTAVVYQVMGEYEKSLEFHLKALKIRLDKFGDRHVKTGVTYSNLGIIYYYKGYFDKAIEYHKKALEIRMASLGARHQGVASNYINLGVVYRVMADYDKAEEMYAKALDIFKQTLGENHPRVATIYSNLGIVYDLKGDVEKSLSYYKKALSIRMETLGAEHPDVANTYNDMGILFSNQEDYEQALYYYDQSFRIRKKIFKGDNPFLAMSYNNLGLVYQEKKSFELALSQYEQALAMNRAIYGERHVEVATGYLSIGDVYFEQKKYDSAGVSYRRALEFFQEIHAENHPLVAQSYRGVARIEERHGRLDEALRLAELSLRSVTGNRNDSFGTSYPVLSDTLSEADVFDALSLKAELFEKQFLQTQNIKSLEQSLETFELISELLDRMRYSYRAEGSKLFLAKKSKNEYEKAIRVSHRLYRLTGKSLYAEKAFAFSEKSKAGVLMESMLDANARKFGGIPDSLLAREKELRMNLSFYDTQIQKESGTKKKDSVKINEFENRVFVLKADYDKLIMNLEKDNPNYYRLKYRPHTIDIPGVRRQLGSDASLIEYFVGDSALFIFTLNADGFEFQSFPKDTAFESVIKEVRQSIVDLNFKAYPPAAYRAYRWLIAPIAPSIQKTERLYVIPDGVLNYLPFDILLTKEVRADQTLDFTKLPYLIKDRTISYYYSAGFISSPDAAAVSFKKNSGGFLGFAPVFSDSASTGYVKSAETRDSTMRDVGLQGMRYAELPYTEKEVNDILKLFEKSKRGGRIYVNDAAKESNFKSVSSEKFRFIHIASHGFINESNPKLSGIIFSQRDTNSSDDGVLYAGEIYDLKLDAELVALSACKSGWGKIIKGEGIMGLTRGFIYSGAKNVLVSLWQVGDESASELMIQFYEYVLSGNDLSTSLRKAKLDFIRQKKYAYPADWSAFVLIGR
ncbi:CHAT domain-containing protein [bacterium]|nr:CHAT domain-containing protein [bacterium]